jgi:hypothetical protein
MTTTRNLGWAVLGASLLAAAGCDRSPTQSSREPSARGAPTPPPALAPGRRGNVAFAGGADADTLVRHTAARWAAEGHRALRAYVDTSRLWDGYRPASVPESPARDAAPTPTDLSGLVAEIMSIEAQVSVNGTHAIASASAGYHGTDAHLDMRYGADFVGGGPDIAEWSQGFDDGHFWQKTVCAGELMSFQQPPVDCLVWTGTVRGVAALTLARDCGETVHASASAYAWYELPVPIPTVSTGGAGASFQWKRFGQSVTASIGNRYANQPECPKQVVTTPTCPQQIISDGSPCDPMAGDPFDPSNGTGGGTGCAYFLVKYEISYDHGQTWQVVYSYIQQVC